MKLRRARIQNFRSIVDSEWFDVEAGVTVIIGQNETGKTTTLRALESFNQTATYRHTDFPNHLLPELTSQPPASILIVTLEFALDQADIETLAPTFADISLGRHLVVTKFYDGHYEYSTTDDKDATRPLGLTPVDLSVQLTELRAEMGRLRESLDGHAARYPPFAASVSRAKQLIADFESARFTDASTVANLADTFIAALKALPQQDKPIQDDFATVQKLTVKAKDEITEELEKDRTTVLWDLIPNLLLHDTGRDRVPDRVSIADFVSDPIVASRGMANLCKAAGLSVQKIKEVTAGDPAHRVSYEDYYSGKISGGVNEFWTQEEYTVFFAFVNGSLEVQVTDLTYSRRVAPSARSDGFQWFLSFYSALTAEAAVLRPRVLLLDNPALELHADGQRDVKRFLEDRQVANAQIIYVTHSPAMVDTFRLEQVRKVERLAQFRGTKVKRLNFGASPDLLEPVRSAIGASLVNSLMFDDLNVLVEGAADKPILEGAFTLVPDCPKVAVNGSVAETRAFLPRFYARAQLPYVVYHDHDSAGRELAAELIREGIARDRVIGLGDVLGALDRDMELEDVMTEEFYGEAVRAAYPQREIPQLPAGGEAKKRTRRYAELFEQRHYPGYSKMRVADKVKELIKAGRADEKSTEALIRIAEGILERLKASQQH